MWWKRNGLGWLGAGCMAVACLTQLRGDEPEVIDLAGLRTLVETRNHTRGNPAAPWVAPGGRCVLFLRSGPRDSIQALYRFDMASGSTREWVTSESLLGGDSDTLSPEEAARRERQRQTARGIAGFLPSPDGQSILVPLAGRLFVVDPDRAGARALSVAGPVVDPRWSPDGRRIAYVRDHDLWVHDLKSGREHRLTRGGSADVTHGEAEFVAQEEMDRHRGFWWSPDSRRLLFEEADARGVEIWQVGDPFAPGGEPAPQRYPRPGRSNVSVRLGIVPVRAGAVRWLEWDRERLPYVTQVSWETGAGPLVVLQTRDQKTLEVHRFGERGGRGQCLMTEMDPAWVNIDPQMPLEAPGGDGFLWTTERNGAWQAEWRHPDGRVARVVAGPETGWRRLVGVDWEARDVWYEGGPDPTRQAVWRVSLDGGDPRPVSGPAAWNTVTLASDGSATVHASGDHQQAMIHEVRRRDGTLAGRLPSVAEVSRLEVRADFGRVGEGDGWETVVLRPANHRPGLRYPVILSVYGGPHVQTVQRRPGALSVDQWLADQGFIVVRADGRGTPGRGRDWERALHGRLGTLPLEEQVAALGAVAAANRDLDLSRVGITGWSFGGYLSALAVIRRPDVFKAGVAGAPVTDWYDYDTHYTERYLGVPPSADPAYASNSALLDAAQLQRPLLLIHGTRDDNVYLRHSLRLTDALVRGGRPFDFLPLAGFTHMVPDAEVAAERWRRTVMFFRQHLGMPR